MTSWASRIAIAVLYAGFTIPTAAQMPPGPLRLSLACQQTHELAFRFAIQNVSTEPAAAVIGIILGNDRKYLPGPLSLTVRRAGVPDVHLQYVDLSVAAIAGRIDPWLITLPAGASYSVAVPARNFLPGPRLVEESFSAPAELQLQLTTQETGEPNPDLSGLRFIRVWIGTLVSDRLQFPGQCHRTSTVQ